jgi:tryptophan synthase beta chain
MVRDFQAIIGMEVRQQILQKEGSLPQYLVACIGGGSNAMGLFAEFLKEPSVALIGVEAAGEGLETERHAASLTQGSEGVLHGSRSLLLQDEHGQVKSTHSISAGLDYPGVGPQLADLKDRGVLRVASVTDEEAIQGFELLAQTEGIIPALESSHALGFLMEFTQELKTEDVLVVNLSGRGDKDLSTYLQWVKK